MSDSSTAADSFVTLTVTPDTGLDLVLDSMEASEELGRPFLITLDVSSATAKGDLHAILGSSATVTLTHPTKDKRYFNGVVARMRYRGLIGGAYRYRMELRPWIWLLSHQQDCRIFSSKSPWTIMTTLFRDAGFTDFSDKRQNSSGDAVLDYCVQYRESTFDFVTRLMEQFGIYYFVTHSNGSHSIAFADDPNSHTALGKAIPFVYDQTDWRTADDHVWDWEAEAQIRPGAYTLREYNFTTPKADLTAKSLSAGNHTYGTNEVYDYPGLYDTADDGQKFAQVRMQDKETQRVSYGGTSNARGLGAGVKFTLSGFSDAAANQEYLVTESICSIRNAETRSFQDGDIVDTFQCAMKVVPGSRPFRLRPVTPRPVIRGPQTARVAGESGQEITTDQYGRIKVKFPWDRRTEEDETSSCWIRVAQVWAGTAWGAMFIPRIGQEVIVEFLEGNPDRPLVTGQVYNADMTVPYGLPDNKTRSTIKSNSSLNGGGFNEFRFEDKKDSEEVFLQAQKDFNVVVLNNETVKITQDTTTTVDKGNRSVTVSTGNNTLEVSQGNRSVTVDKGNDTHTVSTGNRDVTVSKGNDTHTVSTGNRGVTVSQGNDTHTISTGNREVTVSTGKDTLTVSTGDHTISVTAGSSKLTAGTAITLAVGANSIKIDTTGVTISATKISISATAELEASGLTTSVAGKTMLKLDGGPMAELTGGLVKIN